MTRLSTDDLLARLTTEALDEFMRDARVSGRLRPLLTFMSADAEVHRVPLKFNDYLMLARSLFRNCSAKSMRAATKTMGITFHIDAVNLGMTDTLHADQLGDAGADWEDLAFDYLETDKAQFVAVVDCTPNLSVPEEVVAIGLHPARIIGLKATCRPRHRRGFRFGPVEEMPVAAVRERALAWYLRLFGPMDERPASAPTGLGKISNFSEGDRFGEPPPGRAFFTKMKMEEPPPTN